MAKIAKQYLKYITFMFYLLDLFIINLLAKKTLPTEVFSWYYIVFIILAWTIISLNFEYYQFKRLSKIRDLIIKIIKQFVVYTLICYSFSGIYKPIPDTTLIIKYTLTSFIFITIFKFINYFLSKKLQKTKKIIIIGSNEKINEFIKFINQNPNFGYKIAKTIMLNNSHQMSESIDFVDEKKIDEIYCSLDDLNKEQLYFYTNYADNNLKTLKFIANQEELLISNYKIEYYGHIPIASYINIHKEDKTALFLKRLFDVFFALSIIILILSWLVPIISIIIKITSKGPIFYRQERIGKNEKAFKIIKFRSMKIDAESSGPKLSSDNDNRITSIGKIMRKYRIDEFPQFLNVLKGEMSIVGPRPEREFFINEILKINPKYKRLHNVKPGITSLGQVYYGYAENIVEMNKRLQYDLLYLKNFSFKTDIKIIILTILIVFKGKGK